MSIKCSGLIFLIFSFIVNPLLQAKCKEKRLEADYVIVGVGTAGAVLAKQLSDDKKTTVIALHNGENLTQDPEIKYSKNAFTTVISAIVGPPFYENGETTPQPGVDGRELFWALALPEGGASSINAGAWVRGTNQVYAGWEAVAGPEWSVNRIQATYKELENYHGTTSNPAIRGFAGPIDIRQVPSNLVGDKFAQSVVTSAGVPFVVDYNDPNTPIGASNQLQDTQKGKNGRLRVSSATAFLNRQVMTPEGCGVDGRKLRVLFSSTALNVIWKGTKAVGVKFLIDGAPSQVFAKKGVIVCAGLRSSSFLLHSGIGPASLLQSLNIPVVFDNPNVGKNLADQVLVPLLFSTNPADFPAEYPNSIFTQISCLPAPGGDPLVRKVRFTTLNLVPGLTAAVFDLIQPESRGSITIDSADPLSPPVIDLGIFSNPNDLQLYIQAFQTYITGINNALQLSDPLYKLVFPDPSFLADPDLLQAFIEEAAMSNQCFQSHCRMAPLDQGGVVNSQGFVHGVSHLLVADDSIVPVPMDGTPMATAYLIAANIARMLIIQ